MTIQTFNQITFIYLQSLEDFTIKSAQRNILQLDLYSNGIQCLYASPLGKGFSGHALVCPGKPAAMELEQNWNMLFAYKSKCNRFLEADYNNTV